MPRPPADLARCAVSAALQCGPETAFSKAAECSQGAPKKKVDQLACCAVRGWQFARLVIARLRRVAEILRNLLGLG